MTEKKELKNILVVVGFPGIGDLLVAVPVFRLLRQSFPQARLYLTIRNQPAQREVLKGNPYIDEIIIFDKRRRGINLSASIKLLRQWRRRHFDCIVILHHARRYGLLAWLAGAEIRLGYNTKGWRFFLTNVSQAQNFQHETLNLLEVVKPLGIKSENLDLEFWLRLEDKIKAENWLKEKEIKDFIIIHPVGGWWGRRWPGENYSKLADYIIKELKLDVVFTGVAGEKKEIEEIVKLMREKPFVAAGDFTIKELASLYEKAKLFIGTDTGAAHIASAVSLPILVMFGPQDPRRWKPQGESVQTIYKRIECSPCLQKCRWKRNICMEKIKVDEVIKEVEKILLKR